MDNQTNKKITPARKAMINALKLTMTGNSVLAKKELKKAEKELNKQYKTKN
jgi:cellobiose-specific phosphotransferase system component IIA